MPEKGKIGSDILLVVGFNGACRFKWCLRLTTGGRSDILLVSLCYLSSQILSAVYRSLLLSARSARDSVKNVEKRYPTWRLSLVGGKTVRALFNCRPRSR